MSETATGCWFRLERESLTMGNNLLVAKVGESRQKTVNRAAVCGCLGVLWWLQWRIDGIDG